MKKYFYFIFLFVLAACSSNEEEVDPREAFYREAIIGSWAINTIEFDDQIFVYDHTEGCEKDLFQFYNEEGKEFEFEELVVLNCPNCAECAISQSILRWELIGNKINFYFGEQYILQYEIVSVTDTTFSYRLRLDVDNDGELDEITVNADYYDPYNNFN